MFKIKIFMQLKAIKINIIINNLHVKFYYNKLI